MAFRSYVSAQVNDFVPFGTCGNSHSSSTRQVKQLVKFPIEELSVLTRREILEIPCFRSGQILTGENFFLCDNCGQKAFRQKRKKNTWNRAQNIKQSKDDDAITREKCVRAHSVKSMNYESPEKDSFSNYVRTSTTSLCCNMFMLSVDRCYGMKQVYRSSPVLLTRFFVSSDFESKLNRWFSMNEWASRGSWNLFCRPTWRRNVEVSEADAMRRTKPIKTSGISRQWYAKRLLGLEEDSVMMHFRLRGNFASIRWCNENIYSAHASKMIFWNIEGSCLFPTSRKERNWSQLATERISEYLMKSSLRMSHRVLCCFPRRSRLEFSIFWVQRSLCCFIDCRKLTHAKQEILVGRQGKRNLILKIGTSCEVVQVSTLMQSHFTNTNLTETLV